MKKILIAAAIAATALATPAMAQDNFAGLHGEIDASVADVTHATSTSAIQYGAAVGIDAPVLSNKLLLGIEANADNFATYRNYGISARVGVELTPVVLVYGKVGYADFRGLDGARVGAGLQYAVTKHLYVKAEYRYSGLQQSVHQNQALVGGGFRF